MIQVCDFAKRYGQFTAVDGVSFSVSPGRVTGLLGPNGAGKTTILKAVTGVHYPSSGTVMVENFSVCENPLEVKKLLGYVPENPAFYMNYRVREYLSFIADARLDCSAGEKRDAADRAVQMCSLETVYTSAVRTLSKGYRQRLALAQAVIHDPPVLVLDEPTSGLAPSQIQEMRRLISGFAETKTVLLSTHIMQEAEAVCSDILIISGGRLAASGPIWEVVASSGAATLEDAFLKAVSADRSETK